MIKIVIGILLLLSINLSADLYSDGVEAYNNGDKISASRYYLRACKGGSTRGCLKLGILYYAGDGIKVDIIKAKKLFAKACKELSPDACYYLANIYKRGLGGVKRDFKKARTYYRVGCKQRLIKSCKEYNLIRNKREIVGTGNGDHNFSYTYTTEVYGG